MFERWNVSDDADNLQPDSECLLQHHENGVSAVQSSQQSTGLPTSLVYRMSCEHFSRPLLDQQVRKTAFPE